MSGSRAVRVATDWLLIGGFLAFLLTIGVPVAFNRATDSEQEMRPLAPKPFLNRTLASWKAFPSMCESYIADRLGFRTRFVAWNAVARNQWLNVSTSRLVIRGEDGWLYYDGDEERVLVTPPDAAKLRPCDYADAWEEAIAARRAWLAARGIRFVFAPVPQKQSVYPDHLPRLLTHHRPASAVDLLSERLTDNATFRVVDLRTGLRESRREWDPRLLFFRTDSHWTMLGGFEAARELQTALGGWFPAVRPVTVEQFEWCEGVPRPTDLIRILGLPDPTPELWMTVKPVTSTVRLVEREVFGPGGQREHPHLKPQVWVSSDPTLPRGMVLHDSFMSAMLPFMTESFSELVCVPAWSLDADVVERFRPDVVIQAVNERFVNGRLPADSPEIAE